MTTALISTRFELCSLMQGVPYYCAVVTELRAILCVRGTGCCLSRQCYSCLISEFSDNKLKSTLLWYMKIFQIHCTCKMAFYLAYPTSTKALNSRITCRNFLRMRLYTTL